MNDMQQTLEDWADSLIALYGKRMNQVAQWTAREAIKARLQQAYEAGEIAMKEKAAKRVEGNSCAETCKHCQADPCGKLSAIAIRALPLSGAEESKKEKA